MESGFTCLKDDPHRILEISTRMVDCGMGGLSRKIRLLPEKLKNNADWILPIRLQIGEFYTLVKCFNNIRKLDDLQKEDLLNFIGIPFTKKDFKDDLLLQDEFLFLGYRVEHEEKIIIRRNWFYGIHSKRMVLFLEFQFNRFVQLKYFKFSAVYRSAVQFYPSKVLLRVNDIDNKQIVKTDFQQIQSFTLSQILDQYCEAVILNPFIRQIAYIIRGAELVCINAIWYFRSDQDELIFIKNDKTKIPLLVTYSVNTESLFVCEYFNKELTVLSVILNNMVLKIEE